MGSEASNSKSQAAVRGNGEGAAGPEEFPRNEVFENTGATGPLFGDKKPRKQDSTGASLQMGLSCCIPFTEEEKNDPPGMTRDESTGKPDGPEMGSIDNHGAGSDPEWG